MRKRVVRNVTTLIALILGIAAVSAETNAIDPTSLAGGPTEATGYTLPFDPDRVALAAPLGPVMAAGPSMPETAGNSVLGGQHLDADD
jgi:hypothetical protein